MGPFFIFVALPALFPRAARARPRRDGVVEAEGDEQGIVFTQLCNVLDPLLAVALSSVSNELRTATQALLQHLRAYHEAAAALCRKVGLRSCKELREAKEFHWVNMGLTADELALLGTLGSVLPELEVLDIVEPSSAPNGVQRLAAGLSAGALPAVITFAVGGMHVGNAGASELAAALGRGALPRLKSLHLAYVAIGDAELVALAPALRRRPALEILVFTGNPFGDEGVAALVAPPPPAGAPPPPKEVLTKLRGLYLRNTQITDAGCAALASALDSSALPALKELNLDRTLASDAAQAAVYETRDNLEQPGAGAGIESEEDEEGEDEDEGEDDV